MPKKFSSRNTYYLPKEVTDWIRQKAQQEYRSASNLVSKIIKEAMKK